MSYSHTPVTAADEAETAKILALVASIPLAVDLAAYDLAERAFAPKIVIDYTSLWGGEPMQTTPPELMAAWRGLVPGFDATRHELSNLAAVIQGDDATATADVDGRHWLDGDLWRPMGQYHWRLTKADARWKVTHMTFEMTEERGDRGLTTRAAERAAALG